MRIYSSFGHMLSEVKRDVWELGTRVKSESVQNIRNVGEDYEMKEIIGYSYRLTRWKDWQEYFIPHEREWLKEEFQERISGLTINPGRAWKLRRSVWEPFLNHEGRFDYTYNERLYRYYPLAVEELLRRPNSRQVVLCIYDNCDSWDWGGRKRVPCSLSYQLLRRGKLLHIIYNMRSCDVSTHFKFDVMLAIFLMVEVANRLDISYGTLTHNIGSLHLFKKDAGGVF